MRRFLLLFIFLLFGSLAVFGQASAPSCGPATGTYDNVLATCNNPNTGTTVICYNFTGSPVTNGLGTGCTTGTQYTTSLSITSTKTLYIVAGTSLVADSSVVSYTYTIQAATPSCSPGTGTYNNNQTVTCTTTNSVFLSWTASPTSGVTGYNVYRGTSPGGESGTAINASLVTSTTYTDTTASASTTYYYVVEAYCPSCSPTNSSTSNEVSATIGALVQCETTNGTTPVTNGSGTGCNTGTSVANGGTVTISSSETLKVVSGTSTIPDSAVASYVYTLVVATPSCTPGAGSYVGAQSVTCTDSTSGSSMFYTLTGVSPTCSSTAYSGAINIASSETLEVIGCLTGYTNSSIFSAAYTITAASSITVTATGSGVITSSPSGINCPAVSCSASLSGSVTLTETPGNGSSFSGWGGSCSSSGTASTCPLTVSSALSVSAAFGPSTTPIDGFYFGIDYNYITTFPTTITHEIGRFWDMTGGEWSFIETANNVFTWTDIDSELAAMYSAGVLNAQVNFARTPNFASSNPSDTTCNYYVSGGGTPDKAAGQCDPPSDLNANGTGANLYFRNWVAAFASHVNSGGYTSSHAHVKIYEIWNEPDDKAFWNGSFDQLRRMEYDAYCIIKGTATNNPYTSETCAAVWATVTSVSVTAAIDTTATIAMPSYHATNTTDLQDGQAFLYCTGTRASSSSCTNGSVGANFTDVINYHMKFGNNYPTTLEATAVTWMNEIEATLQPAEIAKPFYNTEGGYAGTGWVSPYTTGPLEAGYVARNYLFQYALGVTNGVWYYWNPSQGTGGIGTADAATAYNSVYSWMVGNTMGPYAVSGSVYTIPITGPGGLNTLAVWDNSGNNSTYTPSSTYTTYKTLYSGTFTLGTTVTIGLSPILLVAGTTSGPIASFNPTSLSFGNQVTSTTSVAQTVQLTNTGGSSMTISSIALQTGTQFAISANTCGSSLGAGSSCNVSVTFTPTTTGAKTDNIVFTDNATGSPQDVALSGTGVASATVSFSPASLAFGNQAVFFPSAGKSVTLTNTGGVTLTITSIAMQTGTQFSISSKTCGSTLGASSSCTVTVIFDPQSAAVFTDNIVFTDSDSGSPQDVAVSGTGTFFWQPQTNDIPGFP